MYQFILIGIYWMFECVALNPKKEFILATIIKLKDEYWTKNTLHCGLLLFTRFRYIVTISLPLSFS